MSVKDWLQRRRAKVERQWVEQPWAALTTSIVFAFLAVWELIVGLHLYNTVVALVAFVVILAGSALFFIQWVRGRKT